MSLSVRTSSLVGAPTFSAWSCFCSVRIKGVWGLPCAAGLRLMLGYSQGKLFLSFECGSSVVQGQSLFNSFCVCGLSLKGGTLKTPFFAPQSSLVHVHV